MLRREARWLDLFARLGIRKFSLRPGRIHVPGEVLSRAPKVLSIIFLAHKGTVSVMTLDMRLMKH